MLFNQFGFRNSHSANHTSINLYGGWGVRGGGERGLPWGDENFLKSF